MIKILLPLLMLFSMQSFALMSADAGFESPDHIADDVAVLNNRCAFVHDKVADNARRCIVTGAATQNLEVKTTSYNRGYVLSMRPLPLEVGWQSTEII